MARIYPATGPSRAVAPAQGTFTLQEIEDVLGGEVFFRVQKGGIFAYRVGALLLGLPKNQHENGFPGAAYGDVLALHWGELGFDLAARDPGLVLRDGDAGSLHWTEADGNPDQYAKGRETC
jgi:hypothetical protein